jgi:hypothetical protein
MLFPRNTVKRLINAEMRRVPLSHWRLPIEGDEPAKPLLPTPTTPTFPIKPAASPDPSTQLQEIAEQLRDITDFQSLAELAQLEPAGAMLMDTAAERAVLTMEQAWQRLLSAINLEELMPPSRSGLNLSPGLAFAASACADAVDEAAAEMRRCRTETFGVSLAFHLPARPPAARLPPGVLLIEMIASRAAARPNKLPLMFALRREHPDMRITHRLFHHARTIVSSPAHRLALLALWRNLNQPVASGAEWTALDEITGVTADAMRALRDWQAARHAGRASAPLRGVTPEVRDLKPYAGGLATEDLFTIREFVYPAADGRTAGIRAFEAWLARQPLLATGDD